MTILLYGNILYEAHRCAERAVKTELAHRRDNPRYVRGFFYIEITDVKMRHWAQKNRPDLIRKVRKGDKYKDTMIIHNPGGFQGHEQRFFSAGGGEFCRILREQGIKYKTTIRQNPDSYWR